MQTLTELLHPLPISEFFDKYWAEKAVLIPGDNHQKFANLFSWQKLNNLLNYYPLKHPEIRLAKAGETLPEITNNEQIIKQCQEGATLIIDRLHEKIEAIAKMVALLRIEIGHRSQVNSYCSFPGHQGFACHYDSHEVFILQISGRKHWRV
ncbi:cupin, partial [Arthrospira sp. PCC 8006]